MNKFLKFNVPIDICYPVGNDPKGIHRYCLCATQKIVKRFRLSKSREMFLVVRGSSGTILAGGILQTMAIYYPDIPCKISVSRKSKAHSSSLSNYYDYGDSFTVVIDDFMETGNTILSILNDLDSESNYCNIKYDLLVITKSYERIKHPFEKRALAFNYILTRFNQIIVNK